MNQVPASSMRIEIDAALSRMEKSLENLRGLRAALTVQ